MTNELSAFGDRGKLARQMDMITSDILMKDCQHMIRINLYRQPLVSQFAPFVTVSQGVWQFGEKLTFMGKQNNKSWEYLICSAVCTKDNFFKAIYYYPNSEHKETKSQRVKLFSSIKKINNSQQSLHQKQLEAWGKNHEVTVFGQWTMHSTGL